jgi:hypothetical protein
MLILLSLLVGCGRRERHPFVSLVRDDGLLVEMAVTRQMGVYGLPIPSDCQGVSFFHSLHFETLHFVSG